MTAAEYKELLDHLVMSCRTSWFLLMVSITDEQLAEARRICEQADAVGFIVDPTKYREALGDGRLDWQRLPVAQPQLLEPLKQAAIDQNPPAVDLKQMLGAGDGAGGSEERQGQRGHGSGQGYRKRPSTIR